MVIILGVPIFRIFMVLLMRWEAKLKIKKLLPPESVPIHFMGISLCCASTFSMAVNFCDFLQAFQIALF